MVAPDKCIPTVVGRSTCDGGKGGGKKLLILTDGNSNEGPITPINTCTVWGAACQHSQHTLHAAFCILTAHTLDTSTDISRMVEVESNSRYLAVKHNCVDVLRHMKLIKDFSGIVF